MEDDAGVDEDDAGVEEEGAETVDEGAETGFLLGSACFFGCCAQAVRVSIRVSARDNSKNCFRIVFLHAPGLPGINKRSPPWRASRLRQISKMTAVFPPKTRLKGRRQVFRLGFIPYPGLPGKSQWQKRIRSAIRQRGLRRHKPPSLLGPRGHLFPIYSIFIIERPGFPVKPPAHDDRPHMTIKRCPRRKAGA